MGFNFKILFLIASTFCNGQSYRPLLDNNNQWHFTTCNSGCLTDLYYTNGDTIVNGMNHKVLDGSHFISRTFLLREDIVAKKVYLKKINPTSISEYLLYDFSLNEGAVFNMTNPLSPFPLHGGPFVLDSIRMKPLENTINYKHFYFSPTVSNTVSTNKVVWIEGIGSKSLINAPSGYANINGVGHLSCFFKNQELVYSNLNSITSCNYQTLNNNQIDGMLNAKLYISNTNKQIIIQNSKSICAFEIYDGLGKSIRNESRKLSEIIEIDISTLPSNFYFLIVYDSYYRRKVFKFVTK